MDPGTIVMERYAIEALAGSGGMSTLYRARDPDGQVVAVKVLSNEKREMAERFRREARLLIGLRHPGIVRCLDSGTTPGGLLCLVMEWLDGVDLSDYLARRRMSIGEAITLGVRMARALGCAHERGIIHRDVKPANIFLCGGQVEDAKLLDFGIARSLTASRLTRTGIQIGTPSYMAPEQIRGDRGMDVRADVFALGSVLFECLTRRQAFPGEHPAAVFYKILVDDPPRVSQVVRGAPDRLDVLLARMLSNDREDRPRDGNQVAVELEKILAELEQPDDRLAMQPVGSFASLGITSTEQHLVTVVLVSAPTNITPAKPMNAVHTTNPLTGNSRVSAMQRVQHRYEELGARFDYMVGGSLIAVFESRAVAADRAYDAARCALDLAQACPEQAIAVATGRAVLGGHSPLGEVIERAALLLEQCTTPDIHLDAVTAGLIENRFAIERDQERAPRLAHERYVVQPSMLLGQATPFVGRVREMAALEVSLSECIDECMARAVLLIGPSGMGKSRLKREFLRNAAKLEDDISTWSASGQPMNTGSPLEMIAQAVRAQADIHENEPLAARRDKLEARVARSVPEAHRTRITVFLGELIKSPWPDDEHVQLRAARRDPRLMGDQIRRAVQDFWACETDRHPVVLVLEDLQWCDQSTVSLLDLALRNLAGQPFFVLALARPDIHQIFPKLWARHDVMELHIRRLHVRAARKLVRAAMKEQIPEERVAEIVAHADGSPLYIEELVRSVAAGREALPRTVLAMVHARLQELPAGSRRVLRAASVFGDRFWRSGVAQVLGGDRDLDHELATLTADEFFVPIAASKFAGEAQYRFRHSLIREAAYNMLTDQDRRLGHQLAGAWLEHMGEADPMVIAEHLERGGAPGRAVSYLVLGAVHAYGSDDPDAALEIAERGIALGARGEYLGELRAVQAKVCQWQGRLADAVRYGEQAMELLPRGDRAWYEVAEDVVAAQSKLDEVASLLAFAREASAGCPPDHDRSGWFIFTARLAWMLYLAAEVSTANELHDQMELEERGAGELETEVAARLHATRAIRAFVADGNPAGLVLELRQAIACYLEAGDRHNACDQQSNAGFAEVGLGLYTDAEATLRAAVATAAQIGLEELVDSAKQNLGVALLHLDKLDEAYALLGSCAQAYEQRGNRRLAAGCHIYLAQIELLRSNVAEAEERARTAIRQSPANAHVAATAHALLARILLQQEQPEPALAEAREALRVMRDAGGAEGDEVLVLLAHAEALHHNGHEEEARMAIASARANLEDRAAKIDHAEWRESFLSRIPDHARTIALYESWGGPLSR